ncbi:MAG TPA: YceI family protein [Cytophagaceae bacterium]|jgi:polyisoprenoid-binding protein YceI|nr:YceI family protein [Cytophagaceae bacterium]
MKKSLLFLFIASFFLFGFSIQKGKYITNTGKVSFFSSTPVEDIDAVNSKVTSILDTDNGDIVFSMSITDFIFKKSLMQTHFNENYMESEKYPKSTFKGKITNFSSIKFDVNGTYPATIEGDITIHNVTKPIKVTGTFEVKDGKIFAKSKFSVKTADYKIDIPKLVFQKIAETIDVTVDLTYTPYSK